MLSLWIATDTHRNFQRLCLVSGAWKIHWFHLLRFSREAAIADQQIPLPINYDGLQNTEPSLLNCIWSWWLWWQYYTSNIRIFFNEDFLELAEKFTFTTKVLNHFHSLSAFKNILRSCLMKDRKPYNCRILKPSFAATTFQIRTSKIGRVGKNVIPQTQLLLVFSEIQVLSWYLLETL